MSRVRDHRRHDVAVHVLHMLCPLVDLLGLADDGTTDGHVVAIVVPAQSAVNEWGRDQRPEKRRRIHHKGSSSEEDALPDISAEAVHSASPRREKESCWARQKNPHPRVNTKFL
eukprot:gene128-biopygen183